MRSNRAGGGSDLATVLRGAAVPYGYTVTVWTSGMMLTRERGLPSVGEVFLFMFGAVAWPLGSFVATSTYLSLATLELTFADRRQARSGSR